MKNIKRIAVWSGPRNLSTALMRSFGTRSDFEILDEPFYAAYLKKFVDVKDYNSLSPLANSISKIPNNLHEVARILFKDLKKKYLSDKKVF